MVKWVGILGFFPISISALEVRVLDAETRRPIEGASVIFQGSTNKTDALGQATAEGPSVIVYKSGYPPMKMSWASGAHPAQFEFKLPPAETISGRVIDPGGNPVPGGVIVVIVPGPLAGPRFALEDFPVISDKEGRWRCDIVPKDAAYVRPEFAHPNFEWPEREFSLDELRAEKADLKVTPVVSLAGRVLGPSGEPVHDAKVVLGNEHAVRDEPETRTDSKGKFAFARQRPQRRLVGVHAEGRAPTLQFISTNLSEILLQKGSPLRVRVEDDSGHPLPAVEVNVTELQNPKEADGGRWSYLFKYSRTDLQGTLVWSNAPAQPCAWHFSRSGYMARRHFQLRPTNDEAVVKLGPAFHLSGTVVDAVTGKPIPEFVLNARYIQAPPYASPGTWYDWTRRTFRGGAFTAHYEEPLFGGSGPMHDWQFRAEAEGYEPALSRVIRDSERGTNIVLRLAPLPPPKLNVSAPTGRTRVTAAVALQPTNAAPGETVTIFIKGRIADGYWIYALETSGSENPPTTITTSLPGALQAEGPWRGPAPRVQPDDSRTLAGEVLFSRRYLVEGYTEPGKHKLRFKLEFQVCNEVLCWPPESIDMEAELDVVKPR